MILHICVVHLSDDISNRLSFHAHFLCLVYTSSEIFVNFDDSRIPIVSKEIGTCPSSKQARSSKNYQKLTMTSAT